MEKKKYGLFTSITMITGIVIGSGIFFKSDDILSYTNGNVTMGILIFVVAAFAIIFGSLTISVLADRTDEAGGIISYANKFVNPKIASSFGWFQLLLYFPTITAVVSWVVGMYMSMLMGWDIGNGGYAIIGGITVSIIYILQVISAKIGAGIQNISMIIKIIPLLLIAIVGLFFGKPGEIMVNDMDNIKTMLTSTGWLAAFGPIAFSFDGWIVSTSVAHEIKNSKKNLPIALIISPLIILVCYILYFVGITSLVGVDQVLAQGNDSAYTAATILFGDLGAKLLLIFIIISVIGTVNGLIMGFVQLPYSLALHKMIPCHEAFSKVSKRGSKLSLPSVGLTYVITILWLVVHYFATKSNMRGDVSEIAISFSYLNYIVLYITVFRLAKRGEVKNKFFGYVSPILAIIGSLITVSGSMTQPLFPLYILICLSIMMYGYYYKKKKLT